MVLSVGFWILWLVSCWSLGILCVSGSNSSDIKVVDIIPFNGEILALYRLHYLKDVVDHFIVVESLVTFRGTKKDSFELDKYKEWLDPIRHKLTEVRITSVPGVGEHEASKGKQCPDCWIREKYTRGAGRAAALEAVKDADRYIFLSCDADEMPKESAIHFLREHYEEWKDEPVTVSTAYFWYNWEWVITNSQWGGAIAVTDKAIRGSDVDLDFFRSKVHKRATIINGGWHCSWCLSVEDIQKKMSSFSHQEMNHPEYSTREVIEENIRTGHHMGKSANGYIPGRYDGKYGYPLPCPSCLTLPNVEILKIPANYSSMTREELAAVPDMGGPEPFIFRNNLHQPHWRTVYGRSHKGGHHRHE